MPFTTTDRRAGLEAMEKVLTPMQRAHRKFLSGRPAARKNTPLGAVLFACDQRERLQAILDAESGIADARVEQSALAVLIHAAGSPVAIDEDPIEVERGKESEAVRYLENFIALGHTFTVAGLAFVVRAGDETWLFKYQIERTYAGEVKLREVVNRLVPRMK